MASCRVYKCSPYRRKTKSEAAEFKAWVCLYFGEMREIKERSCHEGTYVHTVSQYVVVRTKDGYVSLWGHIGFVLL